MVGSGSPTRPYLIGQEGGGNPLQNLDVVDDPTLDLTITGDGTVIDKRLITGKATQSLTNLKDVRPSQVLVEGDIPFWRTDHWEFEPAGTSLPPGGTDGQVLTKQSSTSGDANWETLPAGGGGSVVLEPPIRAAYWRAAAMTGVIATTPILWDTTDTLATGITYTPATGTFTVVKAGWYLVTSRLRAISTLAAGQGTQLRLMVDGVLFDFIQVSVTTAATPLDLSKQVYLGVGSTIQMQLSAGGTGVDLSISGSRGNAIEVSRLDQSVAPGGGGVVVEAPVIISRQQATAIPAVASGATATMTWDTLEYSEGAWGFAAGVFTVPVAGYYQVNCKAAFAVNATGKRELRVLVNGISTGPGNIISATVTGSSGTVVSYSRVLRLAAGDTLRVDLSHSAGVALDVGSSGVNYNSIDITKVPQSFSGSAVSTYGERNYSTSRRQAAAVSCTSGTIVQVPWDTLDYADGITCDAAGLFTVPVAGYYQVTAKVAWDANGAGYRRLRILQSGASAVPGYNFASPTANGQATNILTRTLKCAAGDTIQVQVDQGSGVTLGTVSGAASSSVDITKVPAPVINGAAASGVWGVGPLAPALVGADDLAGREVYIDSKGQLRAKPEVPAPRTARRKSASQTLTAASTYYAVTWDVDIEGTAGIPYSNGVFTIDVAGVYQINAQALFSGVGAGVQQRLRILLDGAVGICEQVLSAQGGGDAMSLSKSWRLAVGTTVTIQAFAAAAGGSITGSGVPYSAIDITRISA